MRERSSCGTKWPLPITFLALGGSLTGPRDASKGRSMRCMTPQDHVATFARGLTRLEDDLTRRRSWDRFASTARRHRFAGPGSRLSPAPSSFASGQYDPWEGRAPNRIVGIDRVGGPGHPSSNVEVRHVDGVPVQLRSRASTAIRAGKMVDKTARHGWGLAAPSFEGLRSVPSRLPCQSSKSEPPRPQHPPFAASDFVFGNRNEIRRLPARSHVTVRPPLVAVVRCPGVDRRVRGSRRAGCFGWRDDSAHPIIAQRLLRASAEGCRARKSREPPPAPSETKPTRYATDSCRATSPQHQSRCNGSSCGTRASSARLKRNIADKPGKTRGP
jgi:hypothetical protein